ncbi:FKBP-type peptidyl-prolyl cis-trans isomerase [Nesterenkonia ebinurensis]|uniref:FKBP-type peptidyl-prolyl cis-trans isomerase n=1 Tax=Nesterenkonia ebinurensis TaxID=2608252 RepID=UPI00123CFC36|nr:FKBP-type peptidyl-prolyl cis-trans isomerase [Nesterenkonia ebinurensis]
MHNHRTARVPLALSAAAALLLTACGEDGGTGSEGGLGDTSVFDSLEINAPGDGEQPEVTIYEELEADENSAEVVNQGSGEQLNNDWFIDYHLTVVDPEDASVLQSTHEEPLAPFLSLPALSASEAQTEQFFAEGLTSQGVTVGSEVAFYLLANPAEGVNADTLYIFEILDQSPTYADGEEQEQSGDLPEIDSEIGTAPELGDHDPESEPPEELTSEVLIAGEGEEIGPEDFVFAQYRGWQWTNGEEFDASWSDDGTAGNPFEFAVGEELAQMLQRGVIDGWSQGVQGHHVGDRILLIVPPEQAYGEIDDEETGLTEGGSPGGTLIFVIDIVRVIDGEAMMANLEAQMGAQQPEQPVAPELSEEELAELEDLAQEHGVSVEELEMFIQMGIPIEELEGILQGEEPENDAGDEDDPQDSDTEEDED